MRTAVISDIHGNLEALEAFVGDVYKRDIDRIICLGDIVGYGANPNECIFLLRSLPRIQFVLGNHDATAVRILSPKIMNKDAAKAILWTMKHLTQENYFFLKGIEPIIKIGDALYSHADPNKPSAWRYIINREQAARTFTKVKEKIIFIGHSHFSMVIVKKNIFNIYINPPEVPIVPIINKKKQIFNCGSIGQPRDGNPKASYLIYDETQQQVEFYRIEYDYEQAAEKIKIAGLPNAFA